MTTALSGLTGTWISRLEHTEPARSLSALFGELGLQGGLVVEVTTFSDPQPVYYVESLSFEGTLSQLFSLLESLVDEKRLKKRLPESAPIRQKSRL